MNYIPSYINDRISNIITMIEENINENDDTPFSVNNIIMFISTMAYSIDKKNSKIENILMYHNEALKYIKDKKIKTEIKNNIYNFINEINTCNKIKNIKRPKRPKIAHVITNRKNYFSKWINKFEVNTGDIRKEDLINFCNAVIKPYYDIMNIDYSLVTYINLKRTIKEICKNDKSKRIISNIYDYTTPLLMILNNKPIPRFTNEENNILSFYFEKLDTEFETLDYIASNEKYYPSLLKFLIKRYLSHIKTGTIYNIYPYLPDPSSVEQKSMFDKLLLNSSIAENNRLSLNSNIIENDEIDEN